MKSKKGLLVKNLVGLILSVAIVFVLLVLLFNLFAPSFDKDDKTAESYFKTLNRAIKTADSEGEGDFFMMDDGDSKLEFYLVYFGSVVSFKEDRNFIRSKQGDKVICVCYWRGIGEGVCSYCEDLKLPVKCDKDIKVVKAGERIKIKKSKDGEYYEFTKI